MPATWTRPWTFAMNLTKGGAAQQPFEYACHEGNYGIENMLNAARKAERDGAAGGDHNPRVRVLACDLPNRLARALIGSAGHRARVDDDEVGLVCG